MAGRGRVINAIEKWWLSTPLAVRWGYIATAIWIAAIFLLKGLPERCPGTDAVSFLWVWEWFGSCRPANELGDFLAGAFAPVAFMWLVIAVLVQAAELRAQREELAETRKEFQLNREVAAETRVEIAAQARAAAASANFLEKQTEIQEAQLNNALLANAVSSCEETLEVIAEHIQTHIAHASWRPTTGNNPAAHVFYVPPKGIDYGTVKTIVVFTSRLVKVNIAVAQNGFSIRVNDETLSNLADLEGQVSLQMTEFDKLPRPVQQRLRSARIPELHEEMRKLLKIARAMP